MNKNPGVHGVGDSVVSECFLFKCTHLFCVSVFPLSSDTIVSGFTYPSSFRAGWKLPPLIELPHISIPYSHSNWSSSLPLLLLLSLHHIVIGLVNRSEAASVLIFIWNMSPRQSFHTRKIWTFLLPVYHYFILEKGNTLFILEAIVVKVASPQSSLLSCA